MSSLAVVDTEGFKESIGTGVVLVDFFSITCPPCHALMPVLERVAEQMEDKAKIVKLDVQESGEIAMEFKVSGVPTLIFFKDGVEQERFVGGRAEAEIIETLKKYL